MSTVENSVCLQAPLPRVWRAISEVEHYRAWHLLVVLATDETDPRKLFVRHRKYGIASDGEIVRHEFPTVFAWRMKVGRLFEWEEEFELERTPHATLLVHRIHMRGLLAAAAALVSKKAMQKSLIEIDKSLGHYLARGLAKRPSGLGRRER